MIPVTHINNPPAYHQSYPRISAIGAGTYSYNIDGKFGDFPIPIQWGGALLDMQEKITIVSHNGIDCVTPIQGGGSPNDGAVILRFNDGSLRVVLSRHDIYNAFMDGYTDVHANTTAVFSKTVYLPYGANRLEIDLLKVPGCQYLLAPRYPNTIVDLSNMTRE